MEKEKAKKGIRTLDTNAVAMEVLKLLSKERVSIDCVDEVFGFVKKELQCIVVPNPDIRENYLLGFYDGDKNNYKY